MIGGSRGGPFPIPGGGGGAPVSYGNTLTVAKSGGDYTSVAAAVAAAVAGDLVIIYPGVYDEVGPIPVPDTISIVGTDVLRCTINFINSGVVGLEMGDLTTLRSFSVIAPGGVGGTGVHWSSGAAPTGSVVDDVIISGGTIGFHDASDGVGVIMQGSSSIGASEAGFRTSGATKTNIRTSGAFGLAALSDAFTCDGATSEMVLQACAVDGLGNVNHGLHVMDGGTIIAIGITVSGCAAGAHIDTGGGSIHLLAGELRDNTIDMQSIVASGGAFYLGALRCDPNKISIDASTTTQGTIISDVEDDEGVISLGQLSVGMPGNGKELSVGEGDSFTVGMHVLTNTNLEVGAWADESVVAASASGSTFSMFPGVAAGNACYIGWTVDVFQNIKTKVNGTALALGAGSIAWEYWNGVAWADVNIMASDAMAPYEQHAEAAFGRPDVSEHLRFDGTSLAGWAAKLLNGITAYWIRTRVVVAITTSALIQQIKLGRSRAELNLDGHIELFGEGEVRRTFWLGTGENLSTPSGGANAPTNLDVVISANISYQQANSTYASGSDIRRAGTMVEVPEGLDTSKVVTFSIAFSTDGTDADPVFWDLYAAQVKEGDVTGALAEVLIENHTTPSGVNAAAEVHEVHFDVDVSALVPHDFLAFMLWRKGATDLNTDAAQVLSLQLSGMFWKS